MMILHAHSTAEQVLIRLNDVQAVVGMLNEDANLTDERLREWAFRRKQFQLQKDRVVKGGKEARWNNKHMKNLAEPVK